MGVQGLGFRVNEASWKGGSGPGFFGEKDLGTNGSRVFGVLGGWGAVEVEVSCKR